MKYIILPVKKITPKMLEHCTSDKIEDLRHSNDGKLAILKLDPEHQKKWNGHKYSLAEILKELKKPKWSHK